MTASDDARSVGRAGWVNGRQWRRRGTSTEAEFAAAGGFTMQDDTLKRLDEAQLRVSPDGLCSIVWHIWHLIRIEDVMVNTLLRGVPEILDPEGW